MKLNLNFKTNKVSTKKFLRPKLLLVALFVVAVLIEAYILYTKVFPNLSISQEVEQNNQQVVHLNLVDYQKMLITLDQLETFKPDFPILHNPFK